MARTPQQAGKLKLILPYPPSINHYYGRRRGGGMYIKANGNDYREVVNNIVREHRPRIYMFSDPLKVIIAAERPDKRRRDIDNIQKCALDALEKAGVYLNDCLIHDLRTYWAGFDPPFGRVVVTLQEIDAR